MPCAFFAYAIALHLSSTALSQPIESRNTNNSKVVLVHSPSSINQFRIHPNRVAETLDSGILELTSKPDTTSAWKELVQPGDSIAIKITATGSPVLSTPKPLVNQIVQGLQSAGIPPNQIIIWDKFSDDMIPSGYPPGETANGLRTQSVVPGTGFDGDIFYFNELLGQLIWGDFEFRGQRNLTDLLATVKSEDDAAPAPAPEPEIQYSNRSYFNKIITKETTKIINLAILSDHPELGVWGASASLAIQSVDNTRRFLSHDIAGDPAVAEILSHNALKDRVVLHIMSAYIAQYAGGPVFVPHYTEQPGLLLLSRDPVALDTIARQMLETMRAEHNIIPIGEKARHIEAVAKAGIGTTDTSRIQKSRINVP